MQVIEKDGNIVITISKNKKPVLTPSQKSFMVATSHGNAPTSLTIDDHVLIAGVNVFYKNPDYVKPPK